VHSRSLDVLHDVDLKVNVLHGFSLSLSVFLHFLFDAAV
jgi:hypothetical protein